MPEIWVLNGPNLNLLSAREPHIYGATTLDEVEAICRVATDLPLRFHQSNSEGEILDQIHQACELAAGIIINPAGLSFISVAIADALEMFEGPVIELHISNIHARDPIYQKSLISPVVTAVIAGLGARGYGWAVRAMEELIAGD